MRQQDTLLKRSIFAWIFVLFYVLKSKKVNCTHYILLVTSKIIFPKHNFYLKAMLYLTTSWCCGMQDDILPRDRNVFDFFGVQIRHLQVRRRHRRSDVWGTRKETSGNAFSDCTDLLSACRLNADLWGRPPSGAPCWVGALGPPDWPTAGWHSCHVWPRWTGARLSGACERRPRHPSSPIGRRAS